MHSAAKIHDAAKSGDLEKVKALLKDNPDLSLSKNDNDDTALHFAALKGHNDIVELLLTNKADVNAKDKDGLSPLLLAANGGYPDVVQSLLTAKADVSVRARRGGQTALYVRRKMVTSKLCGCCSRPRQTLMLRMRAVARH